jgi:hypothetical protein
MFHNKEITEKQLTAVSYALENIRKVLEADKGRLSRVEGKVPGPEWFQYSLFERLPVELRTAVLSELQRLRGAK